MRLWAFFLAVIFLVGLALSGCMHRVINVTKRCKVNAKFNEQVCQCRDNETGRFSACQ